MDTETNNGISHVNGQNNESVNGDILDTMTLKCVQAFFRHGARMPLDVIPAIQEVRTVVQSQMQ